MYGVSPGSTRQLFAIRRLYTYPAVSLDTRLLQKSLQKRVRVCVSVHFTVLDAAVIF